MCTDPDNPSPLLMTVEDLNERGTVYMSQKTHDF